MIPQMWLVALVLAWCSKDFVTEACVNGQDHAPYGGYIHVERYPQGVTNYFKCNWFIRRKPGYKYLMANITKITFVGESKLIIHTARPSNHSAKTFVYQTTKNHTGNETFITTADYFYFEISTHLGTVKEFSVQYLLYNEPTSSGKCPFTSEVNRDDLLCKDSRYCINKAMKCDGVRNCWDSSDEELALCRNTAVIIVGVIFGVVVIIIIIILIIYLVLRVFNVKNPASLFHDGYRYEQHENDVGARWSEAGSVDGSVSIRQSDSSPNVEVGPSIQI